MDNLFDKNSIYPEDRWYTAPESHKPKSMNFEAYAGEGNYFLKLVAEELGVDRNRAARITRAVLHAIRDRLPADDAIEFAQGLPMALKGVFIDQYDVSKTPVKIRHKMDFINYIKTKDHLAAAVDFYSSETVVWALQGVFAVLEKTMAPGQIHQIRNLLHSEIVDLIDHG